MIKDLKKALVLAPHTDDGEFGCGATLAKLVEEGVEVYYVAFSSCEQSVPEGFPSDVLVKEVKRATAKLGIKPENVKVLEYEVRKFNYSRQDILEDLIAFRRDIDPDLIFIPSTNDIHQDHSVIAVEAMRAFKNRKILSYELPWNNFEFSMDCFIVVEDRHLNKKIESIKEYESQAGIRPYASEEFLRSLSMVRGIQIGKKYAEVFEVKRLII